MGALVDACAACAAAATAGAAGVGDDSDNTTSSYSIYSTDDEQLRRLTVWGCTQLTRKFFDGHCKNNLEIVGRMVA